VASKLSQTSATQDISTTSRKKSSIKFSRKPTSSRKKMKLFFILAVATSTIVLLVRGAPHVTSEEMGKAVEQLKEMITSEIQAAEAKAAYFPQARQSAFYPREQGYGRHVSIATM
jgi:hypothetical protein